MLDGTETPFPELDRIIGGHVETARRRPLTSQELREACEALRDRVLASQLRSRGRPTLTLIQGGDNA